MSALSLCSYFGDVPALSRSSANTQTVESNGDWNRLLNLVDQPTPSPVPNNERRTFSKHNGNHNDTLNSQHDGHRKLKTYGNRTRRSRTKSKSKSTTANQSHLGIDRIEDEKERHKKEKRKRTRSRERHKKVIDHESDHEVSTKSASKKGEKSKNSADSTNSSKSKKSTKSSKSKATKATKSSTSDRDTNGIASKRGRKPRRKSSKVKANRTMAFDEASDPEEPEEVEVQPDPQSMDIEVEEENVDESSPQIITKRQAMKSSSKSKRTKRARDDLSEDEDVHHIPPPISLHSDTEPTDHEMDDSNGKEEGNEIEEEREASVELVDDDWDSEEHYEVGH